MIRFVSSPNWSQHYFHQCHGSIYMIYHVIIDWALNPTIKMIRFKYTQAYLHLNVFFNSFSNLQVKTKCCWIVYFFQFHSSRR
jgi:hypothetical protein